MLFDIDIKTFEKYNRSEDVIRCPYGRAPVRQQLNRYARAAVNLYGLISREELVNIFNEQNSYQTDFEEMYILLLPLILKESWYCFYKDYLVHYSFFVNFDDAEDLIYLQADKPRFIPNDNHFLNYENESYFDEENLKEVKPLMLKLFGYNSNTLKAIEEIGLLIRYGYELSELGFILDHYNLIIRNDNQIQKLAEVIVQAKNNARIWENKGHTPSELHSFYVKTNKHQKKFTQAQLAKKKKVGRNEPCPCGSGKKFKKCCGKYDHTQNAQLTAKEIKLFYDTWYGLLAYVNDQKKLYSTTINAVYPNPVNEDMMFKLREVLWQTPQLITDYIESTELPQEQIDLLIAWRDHHKQGMFFILDQQPEFAVFLGSDEEGEDKLYGVKGISDSVSLTLQRPLPCVVEAILLPFKGKIIYDSFISSTPMEYGLGAQKALEEMYEEALKSGLVTTFD